MPDWAVHEHLTAGGQSSFAEFVADLADAKDIKDAAVLTEALRTLGNQMRPPRSKSLDGGLFELRGTRVRIYYGFLPGRRAVLVGGYVKKRTDTPVDVLRLMRARLKELKMNSKNPGLALLEKKVNELGLRREVDDELAQILIEHKIAELRKRRGLTQAALARRSGVSQPMIAQIESGKLNNLTLKTLARTARALGASLKIDFVPRSTSHRRGRPLGKNRGRSSSQPAFAS